MHEVLLFAYLLWGVLGHPELFSGCQPQIGQPLMNSSVLADNTNLLNLTLTSYSDPSSSVPSIFFNMTYLLSVSVALDDMTHCVISASHGNFYQTASDGMSEISPKVGCDPGIIWMGMAPQTVKLTWNSTDQTSVKFTSTCGLGYNHITYQNLLIVQYGPDGSDRKQETVLFIILPFAALLLICLLCMVHRYGPLRTHKLALSEEMKEQQSEEGNGGTPPPVKNKSSFVILQEDEEHLNDEENNENDSEDREIQQRKNRNLNNTYNTQEQQQQQQQQQQQRQQQQKEEQQGVELLTVHSPNPLSIQSAK